MPNRTEIDQRIQSLIHELDREQDLLRQQATSDTRKELLIRQALLDQALHWVYQARLEGADATAEEDLRNALLLMAEAQERDKR